MTKRSILLVAGAVAIAFATSGCIVVTTSEDSAAAEISPDAVEARDSFVRALAAWPAGESFIIGDFYEPDVRTTDTSIAGPAGWELPTEGDYDVRAGESQATISLVFAAHINGSGFVNQQTTFVSCLSMTGERDSTSIDVADAECSPELLLRLGYGRPGASRMLAASSLSIPAYQEPERDYSGSTSGG